MTDQTLHSILLATFAMSGSALWITCSTPVIDLANDPQFPSFMHELECFVMFIQTAPILELPHLCISPWTCDAERALPVCRHHTEHIDIPVHTSDQSSGK